MDILSTIFIGLILIFLIITFIVSLGAFKIYKSTFLYRFKNPYMPRKIMFKDVILIYLVSVIILSTSFSLAYFSTH